jgi:hypothetical protein
MPGFRLRASPGTAIRQMEGPTMETRTLGFRAIDIVFALAMCVTYASLVAGIIGLLDARAVSFIVLIGCGVGGLAAIALFVLWNWEFRRSRTKNRERFIRSAVQ